MSQKIVIDEDEKPVFKKQWKYKSTQVLRDLMKMLSKSTDPVQTAKLARRITLNFTDHLHLGYSKCCVPCKEEFEETKEMELELAMRRRYYKRICNERKVRFHSIKLYAIFLWTVLLVILGFSIYHFFYTWDTTINGSLIFTLSQTLFFIFLFCFLITQSPGAGNELLDDPPPSIPPLEYEKMKTGKSEKQVLELLQSEQLELMYFYADQVLPLKRMSKRLLSARRWLKFLCVFSIYFSLVICTAVFAFRYYSYGEFNDRFYMITTPAITFYFWWILNCYGGDQLLCCNCYCLNCYIWLFCYGSTAIFATFDVSWP